MWWDNFLLGANLLCVLFNFITYSFVFSYCFLRGLFISSLTACICLHVFFCVSLSELFMSSIKDSSWDRILGNFHSFQVCWCVQGLLKRENWALMAIEYIGLWCLFLVLTSHNLVISALNLCECLYLETAACGPGCSRSPGTPSDCGVLQRGIHTDDLLPWLQEIFWDAFLLWVLLPWVQQISYIFKLWGLQRCRQADDLPRQKM